MKLKTAVTKPQLAQNSSLRALELIRLLPKAPSSSARARTADLM